MRVLFLLEPALFLDRPDLLDAHFPWAESFRRATETAGGNFALVGNRAICDKWRHGDAERVCYPLDAFSFLSSFKYRRDDYLQALYGKGDEACALTDALSHIRKEYAPDLVIMSSQNAFAVHAFSGTKMLFIEQALLPRLGHPFRTFVDPAGHQTGSLLETKSSAIKSLTVSPQDRQALNELLQVIRRGRSEGSGHQQARDWLQQIKSEGLVALLALQPPDWVTYEGAGGPVGPADQLRAWADRLPEGWLGVPTYHPNHRLDLAVEQLLAAECSQLRFPPQNFAQGLTESLLPVADGLITISSSCAMTALLMGKRVVVTGRAPYNAWCSRDPAKIAQAVPLTSDEAASTLGFLCHHYTLGLAELTDPVRLGVVLKCAIEGRMEQWLFDMTDWSADRARTLFGLSHAKQGASGHCPVCDSAKLNISAMKFGVQYFACQDCATIFSENLDSKVIQTHNEAPEERANIEFQKTRLQRVVDQLGRRPEKMLDFGCGRGGYMVFLKEQGIDAVGIDQGTELQLGDIASASLDAVNMVEVIEHLPEPSKLLGTLTDLLKPGGILYIESSFTDFLGDPAQSGYIDPRIGHCCIQSRKSMDYLAHKTGLRLDWINNNVAVMRKKA